MSNRRHFLRSVVLLGSLMALRPITSLAARAVEEPEAGGAPEPLSHAAFAAALGTTFVLTDGSRLVLDKVSALERCARTENFSVWLRCETGAGVPQGIQTFEHSAMGRFEMFVVAKTQPDGVGGCEAVFNRLLA